MGRKLRSHLPGCVFHLTARIQGREPLLRGLESQVVALLHRATRCTDARLLAYAIMPNHLHVVLLQGERPLGAFMQPVLCRTALLVHRVHGREGHVFERRYRDVPCTDPDYFRTIVAYVHLNPVRAGICGSPDEYEWTSHAAYSILCQPQVESEPELSPRFRENVALGLRMYDAGDDVGTVSGYAAFLGWRRSMDAFVADGGDPRDGSGPPRPVFLTGDRNWGASFGRPAEGEPGEAVRSRRPWPDLSAIARRVLAELAPDASLDWLRSGDRLRALVAVRRVAIVRALDAGHTRHQIARYLNISLTTVSTVAISLRDPRPR